MKYLLVDANVVRARRLSLVLQRAGAVVELAPNYPVMTNRLQNEFDVVGIEDDGLPVDLMGSAELEALRSLPARCTLLISMRSRLVSVPASWIPKSLKCRVVACMPDFYEEELLRAQLIS